MSRQIVLVEVEINANNSEQARDRVEKILVCIENSLQYANPEVAVVRS